MISKFADYIFNISVNSLCVCTSKWQITDKQAFQKLTKNELACLVWPRRLAKG